MAAWPQFSLTIEDYRVFTPATLSTPFLPLVPAYLTESANARVLRKESNLEHDSTSTERGSRAGSAQIRREGQIIPLPLH